MLKVDHLGTSITILNNFSLMEGICLINLNYSMKILELGSTMFNHHQKLNNAIHNTHSEKCFTDLMKNNSKNNFYNRGTPGPGAYDNSKEIQKYTSKSVKGSFQKS